MNRGQRGGTGGKLAAAVDLANQEIQQRYR